MMKTRTLQLLALTALAMLISAHAAAFELTYEGHIVDLADQPVNGSLDLRFALFVSESGGDVLWEESQIVSAVDGALVAVLGRTTPLPADPPSPLWLEITVEEDVMEPRTLVTGAMYAQRAATADDVPGRDITPRTVSIQGFGPVIDEEGRWVGRVNTTDADNDGFADVVELALGTDPDDELDAPTDENDDGIPDQLVGPPGAPGEGADPSSVADQLEADAAFRDAVADSLAANHADALRGEPGQQGVPGESVNATDVAAILGMDELFRDAVAQLLIDNYADLLRGEPGSSCTVSDENGVTTVSCSDGSSSTIQGTADPNPRSCGLIEEDFRSGADGPFIFLSEFQDLLSLTGCEAIDGDLNVHLPPDFANGLSIEPLSSITHVAGMLAIYHPERYLFGFRSLETVGGSLIISSSGNMVSLRGLERLETVGGSVIITGNEKLISLDGLSSLETMGDFLLISDNGKLISLDGLSGLREYGAAIIQIYNNPMLPQCEAEALAERLNVACNCFDNDPDGECD